MHLINTESLLFTPRTLTHSLTHMLSICSVLLSLSFARAVIDEDSFSQANMGILEHSFAHNILASAAAPVQVDADDGWHVFFFGSAGQRSYPRFSVCHDGPAVVQVADVLCPGDVFEVLVLQGGDEEPAAVIASLGVTSSIATPPGSIGGECPVNVYTSEPDVAVTRPQIFSSGIFALPQTFGGGGEGGLTLLEIRPTASPFGAGLGFMRVLSVDKENKSA